METGAALTSPASFRDGLRDRFRAWVRRRIPAARRVRLGHRNIFIVPSRQGLGFFLVLLLMFIGAVNYQASLAFVVVFLLIGMFLLSILHTFRNLAGLRLSAVCGEGVFVGEQAPVTVILERDGARTYEALDLRFAASTEKVRADLVDCVEARLTLHVTARRRGRFSPGRLTIATVFPFGLCRAWSPVDLAVSCLAWPRPEPCDLQALLDYSRLDGSGAPISAQDDFHGLREYQRGDSLKQVAWKQVARGQGLLVKQFDGRRDDKLWLDWDMFPDSGTEERLSRLCWCVLQLQGGGTQYGLRLPGTEIAPGQGAGHYRRVMEALALYGLDEEGADPACA